MIVHCFTSAINRRRLHLSFTDRGPMKITPPSCGFKIKRPILYASRGVHIGIPVHRPKRKPFLLCLFCHFSVRDLEQESKRSESHTSKIPSSTDLHQELVIELYSLKIQCPIVSERYSRIVHMLRYVQRSFCSVSMKGPIRWKMRQSYATLKVAGPIGTRFYGAVS